MFTNRTQHNTLSTTSIQNYLNNLSTEISNLLETEINWNFDILSLERLSNKRPLLTLGLKVMNRFNVCEYLKCDETVLVNWLTLMESNYKQTNSYHNSTHAGDVLHATAYFLSTNKLSVRSS
jgi:high affinity cAMP-specific and IBMX-insensitive 3',5'-cyclic phosphodiesterase 8